jgi:D-alanyl-D-alanine carboxypeptidase
MTPGRPRASANPASPRLFRLTAAAATTAVFLLLLPVTARVWASDPLPTCRYADVPAPLADPADWQRTLVDTEFTVGAGYVPPDLVPVSEAGIGGEGEIRSLVIPDLRAMTAQAKADGAAIAVQSAYRSYGTQVATFAYWSGLRGYQGALLASARPGHSEHQLGTAIDFRSADTTLPWTSDWQQTPAGAWMAANAWRYGFVMSYPEGSSPAKTCYAYEPWHYRYVGRAEAAAIHASGLSPREYLWAQAGSDAATPSAPGRAGASSAPTARTPTPPPVDAVDSAGTPAGEAAAPTATPSAAALAGPPATGTPAEPGPAATILPALSLIAAAGLLMWSPGRGSRLRRWLWSPGRGSRLRRWLTSRSAGWGPASAPGRRQAQRVRDPAGRGDTSSWTPSP